VRGKSNLEIELSGRLMSQDSPSVIRFRGREEPVQEIFSVRGRRYLALEQLSRRGAWRVFDRHAGPRGDYRVLYRLPHSRITSQRIEILTRLGGPTANRNFPRIVDCTRQGGNLFVVMEWVWGISLQEFLRQVRSRQAQRPSCRETVRLARGLAHGLFHYHRRANIVHGDISPANLIITGGTKNLVLIDFGSAWPVEQSATKEPGDGLTSHYAAPERLARHAVEDFRADVFSLAVVAYEMLTLVIPFDGAGGQAGVPELMTSFAEAFAPPSQLISQPLRVPAVARLQLDELLRVSLALHPDARYATGSDWLAAWDRVHWELQKGSRLSGLEEWFLGCLEYFGNLLRRQPPSPRSKFRD
jgi:serine/threonine protein kinase